MFETTNQPIYIICMSFSLMVVQSPENHELIINHGIKNPHMFECEKNMKALYLMLKSHISHSTTWIFASIGVPK